MEYNINKALISCKLQPPEQLIQNRKITFSCAEYFRRPEEIASFANIVNNLPSISNAEAIPSLLPAICQQMQGTASECTPLHCLRLLASPTQDPIKVTALHRSHHAQKRTRHQGSPRQT